MSIENKSSTSLSPPNFWKNFIGGLFFIPLVAWLYAYALWYMPIIILRFMALAFLILGAVPVKALSDFNIIKDKIILSMFSLIAGIFVLYLSWAIWLSLAINLEGYNSFLIFDFPITHINYDVVYTLFVNPDKMFSMMSEIGKTGTWGIRGNIISGFPLYLIWFIELLLVVFTSVKMINGTENFSYLNKSN